MSQQVNQINLQLEQNAGTEKFIVIQVCGGIGNQLFQLANAHQLSVEFKRTLLVCKNNSFPRNIYWDSILEKFKPMLISNEKFRDKTTIKNI